MLPLTPGRTLTYISGSLTANHAAKMAFIADLQSRPIAIEQAKANEQHYEVPTEFLQLCLGPRMKYSSCLWPNAKSTLGDAEDAILASYCVDAKLGVGLRGVGKAEGAREWEAGKEGEGLRLLDLGCGWGSLGLYLAEVGDCIMLRIDRVGSGRSRIVFLRSKGDKPKSTMDRPF